MADELAPWLQDQPPPPEPENLAPWERDIPKGARPTQQVKKPEPEMPTVGSALFQGVGAGFRHTGEGIQTLRGVTPPSSAAPTESPAAAPLEWSDVAQNPFNKLLPKLAYGLGESAPTLAGGLAGGALGAATPVPGGTLLGGGLGAAAGSALQTIGPYFVEELKRSPQDPDTAWSRAIERAAASGATAGAGWAAFGAGAAMAPLKRLAFQVLGIQPAVSVAGQTVQNVIQGEDPTRGLGQAALTGSVGTAIPMAGHAALGAVFREASQVAAKRATDPILSRLGDPEDLKTGDNFAGKAGYRLKLSDVYTDVKDNLNPLNLAEKYLTNNTQMPAELSPYIAARLTRGAAGKADHFIEYGTFDTKGNVNGPSLKEALDPSKNDLEPLRKFMLAKAAVDRAAQGKETGIPLAESQAYIQANPQLQAQFNKFKQYNDRMLDYMTDSGLVGKKDAARMRAMIQDYVPLYRLMDEAGPNSAAVGQALQTWNPIKGMLGSERKILDPIETTIRNTYAFLSLADRNIALQKLEDLAFISPRGKEIMSKVKTGVRPINVTAEETERALARQGITTSADPDKFTIFRPKALTPDENHIRIFRDGKASTYAVDPRLGAAINGLNREQMSTLTRMLAIPARSLRAGATLSPEFIARNPLRDQFSAFIFSTLGRGYVPLYDLAKGAFSVVTKDKSYQDWLRSGGANSAMVSIDRNYIENLVRKMSDPSLGASLKNIARSPLEPLRAMSELMENATRVGEFRRQMGRGASREHGAFSSREATLDFQRIGAKMQGLNAIIAFFNAQAEGVDRMFRSMKEQPLGFAAKVAASITLPSVYLWWAQKDDPRIDEIPRWEKDIFWPILTDNWQPISERDAQKVPPAYLRKGPDGQLQINKGNIWRIPKPFELGVAFGSIPERLLDAYYKKNPNAFKDIGKSVAQAFLPNFIPQMAGPVIEQYANRSLFTDRPLIPKYLEELMPQYQANPYTSDTAQLLGKGISKIPSMGVLPDFTKPGSAASPIIVENYIRSWLGGVGQHALALSDAALRGAGITPTPILPTLTPADKTLMKAFAVRFPEGGANSIQDFYEEFNKRTMAKKTKDFLAKAGRKDEAADIARENVIAKSDALQKAIGAQLKMVRNVYLDNSGKYSPEEKRHFIDMSYLQAIKMAQNGLKMFKDTEDAFKKQQ